MYGPKGCKPRFNAVLDAARLSAYSLKPSLPNPVRTITFFTATSIVIANMVGTGVFTSLGYQVQDLPSGFTVLALWALGGICALCGALCYAELAAAMPRSGGEYHFLSKIFHPAAGFLAGWISATVGFAAPIAAAAMAFGTYGNEAWPALPPLALSFAIVWICSGVHFTGNRRGSRFQNVFTILKLGLIVAFIVAGFCTPHPEPISFIPQEGDWRMVGSGAFAVSLVYVMYSYSGWNASTYIVGEVKDPERNVPRSVIFGTLIVLVLYTALNAAFLHSAPMAEMAAAARANKPNVGAIAASHIFGAAGGRVMDALICLGLVSTISSMVWIGPRVSVAMGEDIPLLRLFSKKTRSGIPRIALLFQFAIVNVLLFTTTFEMISVAIQFVLILCSSLTVLGVIVLRIRQPDLPRPYRTWGYPLTPVIFLSMSVWMMWSAVHEKPWESLAGVATMAIGLVLYFGSRFRRRRGGGGPPTTPIPSLSES